MADPQETTLLTKISGSNLTNKIIKVGGSILVIYSLHYGTTKGYNMVCVPDGLSGYLFGFITTASPWCKFMLELMKVTENQYSTIILIVLSSLIMQVLRV
jgi:hypothetical protein